MLQQAITNSFGQMKTLKNITKEIEVINGPNRNYTTEKSSN